MSPYRRGRPQPRPYRGPFPWRLMVAVWAISAAYYLFVTVIGIVTGERTWTDLFVLESMLAGVFTLSSVLVWLIWWRRRR